MRDNLPLPLLMSLINFYSPPSASGEGGAVSWNETCARGRMDAAQKKQNWGYRWCEEKKKRSVADVSFHSTYPRTQTRRKEKIQQSASFREECAGTNTHGSWKLHDSTICGSICKRSPHGAGICKQSPALRWNLFFPDSRGLRRVRR